MKTGTLALLIFLTLSPPAHAGEMSDAALASYISGRLKQVLADEPYRIPKSCDDEGCTVVVE